jgi:DNA-binding response OmpR family regulator
VLDVNLPDIDGFSLCQAMRTVADIPVILLTVRNHEEDILRGFEVGADDYMSKPFSPRQLVARARAVLRRAGTEAPLAVRRAGDWQLDPVRREITNTAGQAVLLSVLENQLLDYLLINSGQVVTFQTIIDHLWGPEGGSASMVRQLVYRLRSKLQTASPQQEHIHTVAGIGYEFKSVPPV